MKPADGLDFDKAAIRPSSRDRTTEIASLGAVRSRGEIRIGFRARDGVASIADGYQAGCLRFRMPSSEPLQMPCAILLNTSGGLTGGDRLVQRVEWGVAAAATVTGQAAEKIYRAIDDHATIETRLTIGARAHAEWLPQETILFDQARLTRDMQVDMAKDAAFLGIEAIVLGRTAMDETMRSGALTDRWRIRREGRLIYADALRIEGQIDRLMQRAALGAGARAMAVIVHISSRATALIGAVRAALGHARGVAAASCWNGMLVTRLLAHDGAILRHDMLRVLSVLRDGRPMPRVWNC